MIHPEIHDDTELAAEADAAYYRSHPHIDPLRLHGDLAAIEWRHGYITAALALASQNA